MTPPLTVTVHGNQSSFSFSIRPPLTVTVHGNQFPALSQCMGIIPLHCHTAWESIPLLIFNETSPTHCHSATESILCIVTKQGSQFSFSFSVRPPSHCHSAWESIPLLIFYETSPHCHSARESIPLLIFYKTSPSLSQCIGINPPSHIL
jgi:hypothetical protein